MRMPSFKHCSCLQVVLGLITTIGATAVINLDGSPGSYVMYPPWHPCLNSSLSFKFKTRNEHSLLLYLEHHDDFLEIQLMSGSVQLNAKIGYGVVNILTAGKHLNDGKWHTVTFNQYGSSLMSMDVDGVDTTKQSSAVFKSQGPSFSDDAFLFFGGLPIKFENEKFTSLSLPSVIFEPRFQGSIGNFFYQNCQGEIVRPKPLEYNGVMTHEIKLCESHNPCLNGGLCLETDMGLYCDCSNSGHSGTYCEERLFKKCTNSSCANNGQCVQHWASYNCNCDMTSFTGPTCEDESVSYLFGSQPGLISYLYPDIMQHSTFFDSLAFGIETLQDEASLVRIDSKPLKNFIQLELIRGHVYLTYRLGSFVHHLTNFNYKVNDGQYHVVQFTRAGPNVTLRVDSNVPQTRNLTDDHSHIYNNPALITIGGKKTNGSIIENFEGLISGLVFNGIRVLELAKQKNPKVKIEGNVFSDVQTSTSRSKNLLQSKDQEQMMSMEGDVGAEEDIIDDIIFAGTDQSCYYDREEDCSIVGSGNDEIITAVVIIKSTTKPSTSTDKHEGKCGGQECKNSSQLHLSPDMTPSTSHTNRGTLLDGNGNPVRGDNGDIYSSEHKINDDLKNNDSTDEPDQTIANKSKKGHKEINLGLILGVSISVLVAVIVLVIALYKLRSRNEGIYKVDETQNFSAMQSQKPVGNGIVASGSEPEPSSKRGRMKDVKEWYV